MSATEQLLDFEGRPITKTPGATAASSETTPTAAAPVAPPLSGVEAFLASTQRAHVPVQGATYVDFLNTPEGGETDTHFDIDPYIWQGPATSGGTVATAGENVNQFNAFLTQLKTIKEDMLANKNDWQQRLELLRKAMGNSPVLTPAQQAAFASFYGAANRYNEWLTNTTSTNTQTETTNTNQDAVTAMVNNLNATAQSALDAYIDSATQERALRAGMMTSDFNRGGGALASIQDTAGQVAAAAEGAQAFGFTQQVAANRDAAEQAFLGLSLDQQNLALQNAGITLSEDIAANKTAILNWVNDLENTIKTAQLGAQGETATVIAEIQRVRNEVAQGQMDRNNAARIVMGVLGTLTLVAAAGVAIGTAGAATPLSLGIATGGASMLAGSLTG